MGGTEHQTAQAARPPGLGWQSGQAESAFGAWVRRLRVGLDLTQEALAEQVGCATQTMRSFESGRRRPSRELALRLADCLRVPADERESFLRLARPPVAPLEGDAPPVAELAAVPPAPPSALEPLIGRHQELVQLHELLVVQRRRLVTLLGTGGVGKTRLALQAVADLGLSFADSAVLVPLAALSDPADLPGAVAGALGCPLAGSADPVASLLAYLDGRELLLVLDNLEHLLVPGSGEQTRAFIGAILRTAPGVTLLTTSRERVHLQAEWTIELAGLGLPPEEAGDSVAHAEAVLLFVERARRVSSRFALTTQNEAAVAAICRRLDGLPLALELAASQMSFLPPAALLARLSDALPLLEQDNHDLPERQRTMRAAIAWSDDLLTPDARRLFHQLAVFAGPFTLEAAEAVGAGGAIAPSAVLGLLRSLVEQSLVVRADGDETARYRLLEPIRQFALEQLEAQGELARAARGRLIAYCRTLAETAEPLLRTAEQGRWLELLEADYPNLRAVMDWLLAQGELERAARLGHALWLFLWLRGHLSEGQRWMERVLERLPPTVTLPRAHATLAACVLAYGQARYTYAAQLADDAVAQYRALDHAAGLADAVSMVGLIAAALQQHERAEAHMGEAVTRFLAVGNRWGAAMTLNYWAPIPLGRGEYRQAAELAGRALGLARETGDQVAVYSALYNLALVAQHEGDPTTAGRRFREALRCAQALGDLGSCVACLGGLSGVAAELGDGVRAARLWGAAAGLTATREAAVYGYAADPAWRARMEVAARATMEAGAWERAWAEGQAMTLAQAVAEALRTSETQGQAPEPGGAASG